MEVAGVSALVFAALFSGAALYINVAEHPARMKLEASQALVQWKPAYKRGYAMQATLAVLGGITGLAAWWQSGGTPWLAGALLMLGNWPWSLIAIMPVNRKLEAAHDEGAETRTVVPLLHRWNRLHGVRTLLGFAALGCFALASLIP